MGARHRYLVTIGIRDIVGAAMWGRPVARMEDTGRPHHTGQSAQAEVRVPTVAVTSRGTVSIQYPLPLAHV